MGPCLQEAHGRWSETLEARGYSEAVIGWGWGAAHQEGVIDGVALELSLARVAREAVPCTRNGRGRGTYEPWGHAREMPAVLLVGNSGCGSEGHGCIRHPHPLICSMLMLPCGCRMLTPEP